MLLNALDQDPSFYKGGWLLGVQGDAEAITFGDSVFFKDSPTHGANVRARDGPHRSVRQARPFGRSFVVLRSEPGHRHQAGHRR